MNDPNDFGAELLKYIFGFIGGGSIAAVIATFHFGGRIIRAEADISAMRDQLTEFKDMCVAWFEKIEAKIEGRR